ncbi:helix-turn-helix domain-containing protein [Candidatus Woesearchaeota archaeon]|nr:helix-turn-helix domain-containing protein [Candidatus Woesearchaeota archaeon]
MTKEKFVLVSLRENKAKRLAQVISNESCRRILDYLAEKEATETELADKLELPISTVHYNLKHLTDAGLVSVEEFHYSEKGREVNHYKLANKYVIIAPKTTFGIKEKLKSILPVALITVAAAGLLKLFTSKIATFGAAKSAVRDTIMTAAPEAEEAAVDVVATGLTNITQRAPPIIQEIPPGIAPVSVSGPDIALWFLVGAVFAIVIYMIIQYIISKRK